MLSSLEIKSRARDQTDYQYSGVKDDTKTIIKTGLKYYDVRCTNQEALLQQRDNLLRMVFIFAAWYHDVMILVLQQA